MNVRSTIAVAALSVVSTLSAQTTDKPAEGKVDAQAKAEDKADAPTTVPMDKISYLMGREIASMQNGQLGQQGLKIDAESFAQGAKDGIAGAKPKYTEAELEAAYKAFQAHMAGAEAKREGEMKAGGEKAKTAGAKFLADNGKREGVTTTASGLQYEVMKKGDGPKPVPTDRVNVHYHGTLLSGKVFDSSVDRGQPIAFGVQEVIKGWTEALQLMPVGSKWKLFIPSEIAYGANGAGGDIGPNETLIFEVELLGIVK